MCSICSHRQEDHFRDGACRAPGCGCERFGPLRRLGDPRLVVMGEFVDTWARGNRLMCDFLHRGKLPADAA